jgi:hypothetical protein
MVQVELTVSKDPLLTTIDEGIGNYMGRKYGKG